MKKPWIELCSDTNWEDYHGMWARKARDGSWYVLQWTNMFDAAGENCGLPQYECQVKRLDLANVPRKQLDSALQSCGMSLDAAGALSVDYWGDLVEPQFVERAIVEACIGYGLGAPLYAATGDKYPLRVRAEARRYAEQCMKDADLLQDKLDRPVNAIGTSAENYGLGIIFTTDREER